MKDSNAIDVNGLSKSIFDNIIDDVLPHITKLCNLSFEAGIFPEGMKVGKIIPIYKSGSKKICSNYRPISILPFLSKILEKLYNSRLYNFLQTYELLNASQYGFRKNMSTSQAATDYFETITDILKSNKAAVSVSLDLTKAFDSLSHKVLLKKLHHYGIRGVAHTWLKSYLTDRQQTLTLARGEIHSNYKTITHGVPQGSVLGPTLFLIYINDIINSSNIFKYILFADDTTLIYGFDPSSDPTDDINSGLNNTQKWLNCNKLALNVNKTQAILYGKTTHKPVIKINNEPIHFVDKINLLGTIFDKNLTFKPHIAKICSKASRALGLLNQSKGLLPKYIKRTIYFSLIHPHLTQSIELWGGTAKSTINPIITLQKRAVPIISNAPYNSQTNLLFKGLKIPKINDIYHVQINLLMYKAFHNHLPHNIQRLFARSQQNRTTRQNALNLKVSRKSTKIQNLKPSIFGPYVWNQLNASVREKNSIHLFKSHLKKLVFSGY